jgi:thiol-disulfide isomerase/thioredoxin
MKKSLLTLLSTFVVVLAFAQKRTILVEEFTNASCPPCAAFNPSFHAALDKNADKVVSLKYQVNYPGFDPMNQQNNTEAMARNTYYAVSGVPSVSFDGKKLAQYSLAVNQTTYDAAYAKVSPYAMTVAHKFNAAYDSVSITVKVKNISGTEITEANQKLHVAITEETIAFPKAPGTNGEKIFYTVMRKMLPNNNGTAFPESLKIDEEATFTMNVALPKYLYNLGEIAIVAFVQNNATKTVNQAGYSEPQALVGNFTDAAVVNQTKQGADICTNEITPKMEIQNNSDTEITSLDAYYTLNAKKSDKLPWKGSLKKGEKAIITFPLTTGNVGKSNPLTFGVENINEGKTIDYASLNNTTSAYAIKILPSKPAATATKLVMDFETSAIAAVPNNAFLYTSDRETASFTAVYDKSPFGGTQEVGAFGQSKRAFWFNFRDLNVKGETAALTFFKLNLKDTKNANLKFDYSYAQVNANTADKFEVLASSDCGATYKTLFSKAGAALNVVPPHAIAAPKNNEWKTEEISMTDFDGAEEVIMMFRATSNAVSGSLFFLDNINVDAKIVAVEDVLENATLEIAPNPATEFAAINLNLNETMDASVRVFDVTGKQVAVLADNQAFAAGRTQLRWNIDTMPQGVYIVKVESAKGQMTKRVAVVK